METFRVESNGCIDTTRAFAAAVSTFGVVLGALYMLKLYRDVFYGKVTAAENENVGDLGGIELAYLAPLVILIFVLGLAPNLVLDKTEKSVRQVVEMFDEVEAALDEANIDRFLQLVRRFSDRAQFVIVTHQKRTMDAADVLYGVSMGGGGATKVVSRRLPRDGGEQGLSAVRAARHGQDDACKGHRQCHPV